jgi:TetR/AcrR family transcriptional regulator
MNGVQHTATASATRRILERRQAGATMRNRQNRQGTTGFMSTIRERNKELILRAASEEFADKGFAATKTSDIAAKAGLPKPNVYYYFKSKENLYREVLESIIEPILQASTPFNPDGVPSEVLSATSARRSASPATCRLPPKCSPAKSCTAPAPERRPGRAAQQPGQAQHRLHPDLDRPRPDRPDRPHHLMFSIWAATQTYADFDWQISAVTGKAKLDDSDYEAAAQTIIRLVLKGVSRTRPRCIYRPAGWLPGICERHRIRGSWLASDDFRSNAKDQAATPASALNPTPPSL